VLHKVVHHSGRAHGQEQDPSIRKIITILFLVYFGTHNNKIHTIYKETSVFVLVFFYVVVLVLLAK
jgi:hypothetical protein